MPSHRLRPPKRLSWPARAIRKEDPSPTPPTWPSFTGQSQYVGTSSSGRVQVFVDPHLGAAGLQNGVDLVHDADRMCAFNDSVFGSAGGSVQVIVFALGGVADGTGGADHMGCDFQSGSAIEVCASFGQPARVSALFEAEYSECAMGGALCGLSTGEGLSRWCALAVSGNALSDFATAPLWYADGMPNFVDTTDPTDTNANSTGCTMAFLSWLLAQGVTLAECADAMVALGDTGTLAALYATLTGGDPAGAWPSFSAAVAGLGGVASDDPFAAGIPLPPSVPTTGVSLADAQSWAAAGLQENWGADCVPTLPDAQQWAGTGLEENWPA